MPSGKTHGFSYVEFSGDIDQTRDLDFQKIAQALVLEYQAEGFEAQKFGDSSQAIVQLKKETTLRTITGFNKALGISFQLSGDETLVQVGAQDWVDQIAVGAVGLVFYPLLVTAACSVMVLLCSSCPLRVAH